MKNLAGVSLCALAVSLFGGMTVDAQNITTVAGGGPPATGTAVSKTGASIGAPAAVRQDLLGNTYILDNDFSRVYKVDLTGHLTLFAGNGTVGFSGEGGPAVNAAMDGPSGMCIDVNNNVYVADSDNAIVREIVVSNPPRDKRSATSIPLPAWRPKPTTLMAVTADSLQPPTSISQTAARSTPTEPVHCRPRQQRHSRSHRRNQRKPIGLAATTTVAGHIYLYTGAIPVGALPPAPGPARTAQPRSVRPSTVLLTCSSIPATTSSSPIWEILAPPQTTSSAKFPPPRKSFRSR